MDDSGKIYGASINIESETEDPVTITIICRDNRYLQQCYVYADMKINIYIYIYILTYLIIVSTFLYRTGVISIPPTTTPPAPASTKSTYSHVCARLHDGVLYKVSKYFL